MGREETVGTATVARSVSWALVRYLVGVSRSLRYRINFIDCTRGKAEVFESDGANALSDSLHGPTIVPFWNAHSILLLSCYVGLSAIQRWGSRFEAIADDSLGGIITQQVFKRLRIAPRLLRFVSPADRLEDIKGILRDRPNLLIAVDSHGPYRCVKPPIVRLARTYGARLVPISLSCDRGFRLFRRVSMIFPLPGSTVALAFGEPIDAAGPGSLQTLTESVNARLGELERHAGAPRDSNCQA